MMYDLPTSVCIGDTAYIIRSDYRAVLDICAALSDPELSQDERAIVALDIFYPAFSGCEEDGEPVLMPQEHYEEALAECFLFINCGNSEPKRKAPRLVDWQQDFQYIVAPINRILGVELRSAQVHWWTFMSAYFEIGDCLFAQIVRIRDKKARGKALDKSDREWYRKNRDLVDFKTVHSEAESELLNQWINPGGRGADGS